MIKEGELNVDDTSVAATTFRRGGSEAMVRRPEGRL